MAVVGGGLVAQAMHLHYLAAKPDRFTIAAEHVGTFATEIRSVL